jgi:FkbM family methyltransferase
MTITIPTFIEFCKEKKLNPLIIFEIGAREGSDSVLMKEAFPEAEVYAFEAYPAEYEAHKNDDCLSSINYYNLGMWNEEAELTFYEKGVGTGISSFRDRGVNYGTKTTKVKATTVDNFCQQNSIEGVDIVKIDVEGCSLEVLEGFGDKLNTVKCIHLETERVPYFSDQSLEDEVFSFLEKNGFKKELYQNCCMQQYDSVWTKL